jgi:hypothetical protein
VTTQDPKTIVKTSNRLWSSEVAQVEAAEGIDPLKRDPAYEFSNGRKFVAEVNPYDEPVGQ